ncbi:MAG: hypothetical protein Q3M24_19550 [Candidatus Electrothrix aestuarii]|uniref:Plasmid pRiA4b Orf3-like domain-containing protein n=1 Tax=Candidatus Electrothrix aestuarii TaxID=3062594 RepID=A0AAU8LU70_9BACT|nr:hypothetical protein [Candidatus Electrothrix aestuarii]
MPEKKEFVLTSFQEDIFKEQAARQTVRGTVVQNMDMLIGYIGEKGVPVSGVKKHFSQGQLAKINDQLVHPLHIRLKRPLQKSYPHINALYLLLRASGLGTLVSEGKKSQLQINTKVLQGWQELNPTERYFSLFAAWWCRGSDEIVGEREGLGVHDPLFRCLDYIIKLPRNGVCLEDKKDAMNYLRFSPGFHSLALLELFCLVRIEYGEPDGGQGWCIEKITPTGWGRAVIETVHRATQLELELEEDVPLLELKTSAFERWKALVQPFFSDWQTSLPGHETPFQAGVHVVKVSQGKAWRKIAISGESTFDAFAEAILQAFDFDRDHLYQFIYNDRYGLKKNVNHPALEEAPFTDETRLGEISCLLGMDMVFLFDFGDSWEFQVLVEEIDADTAVESEPVLLKSQGKAPEQYPGYDE